MSVVTKIIIDTKEYRHLKEIAAAYKVLLEKKDQTGGGLCTCTCRPADATPVSLSQIGAENDRDHAVSVPPKEIIPSITNPYEPQTTLNAHSATSTVSSNEGDEKFNLTPEDRLEYEEAIAKKEKWYYLGPLEKNVRK